MYKKRTRTSRRFERKIVGCVYGRSKGNGEHSVINGQTIEEISLG